VAGARLDRRDVGFRLVVLYKSAKAVLELGLAVALVALAAAGEIETLREVAAQLRHHVASRWSLLLGRALGALLSERGVHLVELGLVIDGLVSAFEGWSLWRGYRWARWLVVAASAIPLPLELEEIVRTHRASRVALALVNIAVIVYLVRGTGSSRSGRAGEGPSR
jgi:uncharacterized membrane protein (DUF2068 family)